MVAPAAHGVAILNGALLVLVLVLVLVLDDVMSVCCCARGDDFGRPMSPTAT